MCTVCVYICVSFDVSVSLYVPSNEMVAVIFRVVFGWSHMAAPLPWVVIYCTFTKV